MKKQRCPWVNNNPLMIEYHDKEWGTPLKEDNKLFEFLVLDAFQAGLSWNTIINKRENFKKAFHNFNPEKIANYTEADKERLMQDAGIIRNRLKIESAILNAKQFLKLKEKGFKFVGSTICYAFMQAAGLVNDHSVDCFRNN